MAMYLCGARLAVPDRVLRRAIQLAVRRSGARRNPSPQKRTVSTLAFWDRRPAAPAPAPAPAPAAQWVGLLATGLGLIATALTIIMSLQGFIKNELTPISTKLDTLSTAVQTQQVQAGVVEGKVDVLEGVVTETATLTPSPTQK